MSLEYRNSHNQDKNTTDYVDMPDDADAPVVKDSANNDDRFLVKSAYLRECMAEVLGTMVLILFGDGVVAQVTLSGYASGSYLSINLCWGLGVVFGIHASGGISGAHINPAVTVTNAVYGRMPWYKVPGYLIAQLVGAFLGGLIVLAVYHPWINHVDPEGNSTMGIFSTYPNDFTPNASCFLNEVVGSALLLGLIFALCDEKNKPASIYSFPNAVGLLVVAIGMAFGMESGYAINPARDLGPRLASAIHYGSAVFSSNNYYFWIPIVAPLVGGLVGAGIYLLAVEKHHVKTK